MATISSPDSGTGSPAQTAFAIPAELQQQVGGQVLQAAEAGCMDNFRNYWSYAQVTIEHFVMDQPVIAVIVAVVFFIFGISQILPTLLAAILTGIPLIAFSYTVAQTVCAHQEEFAHHLVRQYEETKTARGARREDFVVHSRLNSPEVAGPAAPVQGSDGLFASPVIHSRSTSRDAHITPVPFHPGSPESSS